MPTTDERPDFVRLPDLASRRLAGSVVWASDEFFAEKENLILPHEPAFDPNLFGHKGKVYDGWETRRRRDEGVDQAIIRLGVPGIVEGVTVDTSWFTGNYPQAAMVEGAWIEGYPSPSELADADWRPVVEQAALQGNAKNDLIATGPRPITHARLTIIPDGGVARLRIHGTPTPDPRFLQHTIDLAAMENGGLVQDCSDMFYSSPANIIAPGRSAHMGEGWENARRRGPGNDFVVLKLAGEGVVEHVELDTSFYIGNAPAAAAIHGIASAAQLDDPASWVEIVPRIRLQPDCRHRFLTADTDGTPIRYLRVDVFPDGGISRLRAYGRLAEVALDELTQRLRGATS